MDAPVPGSDRRGAAGVELGPGSVSVVLPVRNEERHLETCLDSVRAQDFSGPMEILVADGRSDDATRDIVRRVASEDPRVRLVDNPGKIVPTAMNAAIREARGEYIVRVDGHATIPPGYVSTILDRFATVKADCVGGKMVARGEGLLGEVIAATTSHPFGVGGSVFHYGASPCETDTVYLGAYRKETLERIGMYDERFVRNQDDELNYRLRSRGGSVWFDPAIEAFYVNRSTLRKLFSQYRQYGYWKVHMYRKHPGLFNARHAVPALFVAACAAPWLFVPWFGTVAVAAGLTVPLAHLLTGTAFALTARWKGRVRALAPAVFLTLHAAYGVGTWQGIVSAVTGRVEVSR